MNKFFRTVFAIFKAIKSYIGIMTGIGKLSYLLIFTLIYFASGYTPNKLAVILFILIFVLLTVIYILGDSLADALEVRLELVEVKKNDYYEPAGSEAYNVRIAVKNKSNSVIHGLEFKIIDITAVKDETQRHLIDQRITAHDADNVRISINPGDTKHYLIAYRDGHRINGKFFGPKSLRLNSQKYGHLLSDLFITKIICSGESCQPLEFAFKMGVDTSNEEIICERVS